MLTLLGSLLGFLSSLVPWVLKFLKEKEDRTHELEILDRQVEVLKLQHSHRLEEIRGLGEVTELKALYRYPRVIGVKWVDALSGSVRPILTYAFFALYGVVKVVQVFHVGQLVETGGGLAIIATIWHEEDQALFAAVMSFWFGQRAMGKIRKSL